MQIQFGEADYKWKGPVYGALSCLPSMHGWVKTWRVRSIATCTYTAPKENSRETMHVV